MTEKMSIEDVTGGVWQCARCKALVPRLWRVCEVCHEIELEEIVREG